MNTLFGIFDFLFRMLPGLILGTLFFFPIRTIRAHRLHAAGLVSPPLRERTLFLLYLVCGGLAFLTLTPRWFNWLDLIARSSVSLPPFFTRGTLNLIPLRTFRPDPWSLMILAGNIIMFIPIGFFPTLLYKKFTFFRCLLTSIFTPLFIECWQLLIGRSFDIDDLLLNALGILSGWMLLRIFPAKFVSRFRPKPLK